MPLFIWTIVHEDYSTGYNTATIDFILHKNEFYNKTVCYENIFPTGFGGQR